MDASKIDKIRAEIDAIDEGLRRLHDSLSWLPIPYFGLLLRIVDALRALADALDDAAGAMKKKE